MNKNNFIAASNPARQTVKLTSHSAIPPQKTKTTAVIFILILTVFLVWGGTTAQAFTPSTQQPASLVLGQTDFTTGTLGIGADQLSSPLDVAVDPTSQKVFVVDYGNHRVLRYASVTNLTNGAAAEAVLGQPDFATTTPGVSASQMNLPTGVFVDNAGRLWVADYGNHRILRFDDAANVTDGANADGVLGQADFDSNNIAAGPDGMYNPTDIWVSATGVLWVADYRNHRVLRFDDGANAANGADADGVLGQADFNGNSFGLSSTQLNLPSQLIGDADGRLWVVDYTNNRVLHFDDAGNKSNGAAADGVLGQPDFTTNTPMTAQNVMNGPFGVALDAASGRLYVAEITNNRILWFDDAANKTDGANADGVLGQADFDSGTTNQGMSQPDATTLSRPYGLFYDSAGDGMWVADLSNNRALLYKQVSHVLYFPLIGSNAENP